MSCYKRGRDGLSLLREVAGESNSNASQALKSQDVAPLKLHDALAGITGTTEGIGLLAYGRYIAGKIAEELAKIEDRAIPEPWEPDSPKVSTLHVLIAMLLFEPDGEPAMVLSKLSLSLEKLCSFARSVELEP